MADWVDPDVDDQYIDVLDFLKARDVDAATLFNSGAEINTPVNAIRYNRAGNKFQEWVGGVWVDKVISLAGGGTGAITAVAARAALALGTLATQNANAVAITGGSVAASLTGSTNIPAAGLTGTIAQARLGTGSGGTGEKFLADDQTYKLINPVGSMMMFGGTAAPTGYVFCDGTSYLRAGTMASLFAVIGVRYGAADGTHFNVPDLRLRFPLGLSAPADAVGTGGTFNHTHTTPNHQHQYTQVPNHLHPITDPGHAHNGRTSNAPVAGNSVPNATPPFKAANVDNADGGTNLTTVGLSGITTTQNPGGGVATGTTLNDGNSNTGTANPPYQTVNYIIRF